jgi:hypothetical protein
MTLLLLKDAAGRAIGAVAVGAAVAAAAYCRCALMACRNRRSDARREGAAGPDPAVMF